MTTEQMRAFLKEQYPLSESWAYKVKHMTDNQVYAVYIRFQNRRK